MARPSRRRKGSHQNPASSPASTASAVASSPAAASPAAPEYQTASEPIKQINARPHLERSNNGFPKPSIASLYSAFAQCTFPAWAQTATMIFLIFGGCCSNVFALEAIVKAAPASGHLITFAQFVLVAFEGFLYHFDPTSKTLLKPNTIPIHRWLVQIALFFSVSLLNNHAFNYNISVPVHIILRSGGSMTTLLVGWLWGKRYSKIQVASVAVLTAGCVLAALGDSKGMGGSEDSLSRFMMGLTILFIAQLLSAIMGLYIEATYTKYGNNYREGLFYTHALSLILFIPLFPQLRGQFNHLSKSPPLPPHPYLPAFLADVPRQVVYLGVNALTQYVCIRGVNMLGAMVTALTVTIVLNVRKLVSLLLSIWLFGNQLSPGVLVGALVVFIGGFAYGVEGQRQSKMRKRGLKHQ